MTINSITNKLEALNLKKRVPKVFYWIFMYALLIGLAYVLLYPLLIMLTKAFRPVEDMFNPSIVWISSGATWENFKNAIYALDFWDTLVTTFRVVAVDSLLVLFICSMAGYGISRFKLKLKPVFIVIMILTIIVPIQTYIVPLYFEFVYFDFFGIGEVVGLFTGKTATINLVDSEFSLYVMNLFGNGFRSGLFILVFMRFFQGIPKELESAARIDGASEFAIYSRIMLPNMKPAFIVVTVFAFVWNWNDFYYSRLLMRKNPLLAVRMDSITELVNNIVNQGAWGENVQSTPVLFAACLLFVIPPLIVYIILQRGFTQSFERSGIVG